MSMNIRGLDGALVAIDKQSGELKSRCEKSVRAAGKLLRNAFSERLAGQNVSGRATGELAKSIKADPVKYDTGRGYYTKVHPDGYDSKGQPLPLIANVLEYGRSGGKGCYPWMQPTVDLEKGNIERIMEEVFNNQ